jgi:uncharacterized protein with HEPN domain
MDREIKTWLFVSMRNRIIHGYDVISDELIWGILINDLPKLKSEITLLLR